MYDTSREALLTLGKRPRDRYDTSDTVGTIKVILNQLGSISILEISHLGGRRKRLRNTTAARDIFIFMVNQNKRQYCRPSAAYRNKYHNAPV